MAFFMVYSFKIFLPLRLCQVLTREELPKMLRYDPAKVWYRPSDEVIEWLNNTQTTAYIGKTDYHEDGAYVQIKTKEEAAIMKLAFNLGEKDPDDVL